ncbi:MAG: PH domain-containing protein [Pirellulales bacterium]|nr:PH domain-containing protein [Pirellulales bacterium]
MPQPIAGVTPASEREATIMTVWPSLAATAYGRWWGRRFENRLGMTLFGIPLTLGRLLALVSIPLILPLYFHMLLPRIPGIVFGVPNPACRRYRLTNRRVLVEQPFGGGEQKSVSLDRFSAIDIEVQPGQGWYPAGDLVFRDGPIETFRLLGVPHPEAFRQTCLKAHQVFVGVEKARQLGAVSA